MSRYTITVESKGRSANSLEEALSVFNGMMYINKEKVKKDLLEKGESCQVYGFCSGNIIDHQFAVSAAAELGKNMISDIHFITDVRPGEVDILGSNNLGDLVISDLDGKELKRVQTQTPWTHEKLEKLAEELGSYPDGADAHINGQMVGSTEI